jgi:hypothetical protein
MEQLTVAQLVTKLARLLCNPKVHYRAHNSQSLDPILSQINPVHTLAPYFYNTGFFKEDKWAEHVARIGEQCIRTSGRKTSWKKTTTKIQT